MPAWDLVPPSLVLRTPGFWAWEHKARKGDIGGVSRNGGSEGARGSRGEKARDKELRIEKKGYSGSTEMAGDVASQWQVPSLVGIRLQQKRIKKS